MLNNIGPAGLILIAVVVLVLFGRGKIAGLMGEVGKGITAFKDGVKTPDPDQVEDASETAEAAARDVTPEQRTERDNA
jgi:sec-independent protein translocase protein TatA